MKKIFVLTLFLSAVVVTYAQQSSIIDSVLVASANEKVAAMQKSIGFNDEQAEKLRKVEADFLKDVNKAEHCFLCNKKKRASKLKRDRYEKLQTILERNQYIKYQSLDNNLLNPDNRLQSE